MTEQQAKEAAETISKEKVAQLLLEHWQMKQCVAAQLLGVPTGASDWINRTIARADQLRSCEHYLRQVTGRMQALAADAVWQTKLMYCANCMGEKTVNGDNCVVCKGTGRHTY